VYPQWNGRKDRGRDQFRIGDRVVVIWASGEPVNFRCHELWGTDGEHSLYCNFHETVTRIIASILDTDLD